MNMIFLFCFLFFGYMDYFEGIMVVKFFAAKRERAREEVIDVRIGSGSRMLVRIRGYRDGTVSVIV